MLSTLCTGPRHEGAGAAVTVLIVVYVLGVIFVAGVGFALWIYNRECGPDNEDARLGARLVLSSPVWPLAALGWLLREVPEMLDTLKGDE